VVHDGGDPLEQRLQVGLSNQEAVGPVVCQGQVSPPAGHDHAASQRAGRCDDHLADVFSREAHAAEAEVDGWLAGGEERLQLCGQRALIGQDPRARLEHVRVLGLGPGPQRGIGGQPGPVGEHVAAHIGDRVQTGCCPVGIERGAPGVVPALRVPRPQFAVAGRLVQWPSRQWGGRVVRGRQGDRAVVGVDVADPRRLRHRAGGDLQGPEPHHDVASPGGLPDGGELGGHGAFHHLTPLLGRGLEWRGARRDPAHLGPDRHHRDPQALDPVAEVRGSAHADFLAKGPQL
jgi:hypothetical protein